MIFRLKQHIVHLAESLDILKREERNKDGTTVLGSIAYGKETKTKNKRKRPD